MIIEITECHYKGILIEHSKDRGWECVIGSKACFFPTLQDAHSAIDEIFLDIRPIVSKHGGRIIRNVKNY